MVKIMNKLKQKIIWGEFIFFLIFLIITNIQAYPLQMYPNGSVNEVNFTINSTPFNIYLYNGTLYLQPENISNDSFFINNITNITCINCTYNITNITQNTYENTTYFNGRMSSLEANLTLFNNSVLNLENKINNFTNQTILSSSSEWRTLDTFMIIGILIALAIGGFALYGAIKLSR